MQVKEISVSVKKVKNMGNYQSFAAEASATVALQKGESPDLAYIEAFKLVNGEVEGQISKAR
jgi:hypothetical protein